MASAASHASYLPPVLTFCAAAVVAVPLFRRLGLSAVIGYLFAGVVIGPAGLSLIDDPGTAASVAELGVVLLLFIVGLELKVSRLLSMRGDIFGLGLCQLALTALLFGGAVLGLGFGLKGAIVTGLALALSATAIALQMLEERGDLSEPYGQRAFAVLLFQDLAIVPILALLPLLATAAAATAPLTDRLASAGIAVAAIAGVVLVGRYGLNPFFRLLAASGAREVLTASALLVVLGAALLLEEVGLSMAMGAFLAGVLLAESNFKHQLEADIEPFRGVLLGLFFMSVGMSIDAGLVSANWPLLLLATPAVVAAKIALIGLLTRLTGSGWRDAVQAGAVLAPAGEFAFVLLPVGAGFGFLTPAETGLVTALAALTMLLGPLVAKALDLGLDRARPAPEALAESFEGAGGRVLVIGFGRFGQTVNQVLLAQGVEVTVIDRDVERIRGAARFGFRVYYGDGTRLDVLRAAGAAKAELICICVDDRDAALRIAELAHGEFRQARTYARAFDRIHAIDLMNLEVDHQTRELFESALVFGRAALEELGVAPEAADTIVADVRRRDVARLMMQKVEGIMGGSDLMHPRLSPEPLTVPKGKAQGLSPETRDILRAEDAPPASDASERVGERV